ncbi:MAG: universal stress protein [Acidobacteriota bacterium]
MSSVTGRRYRIVVALDLSEYSEIVLEHALDVAARHDLPDLHFVTVVDRGNKVDVVDVKNRLADLVLDGLGSFDGRTATWHARLHVRAGKAAEEIVELANEVDANLVALGRFGVHRGVAERVLTDAPCPVLAINLIDRAPEQPQCAACVQIRADSDGERWFCAEHSAPDRVTLATTALPTTWLGGTLMW